MRSLGLRPAATLLNRNVDDLLRLDRRILDAQPLKEHSPAVLLHDNEYLLHVLVGEMNWLVNREQFGQLP